MNILSWLTAAMFVVKEAPNGKRLRILYVENDEALLGLLGNSLAVHPAIEILAKASSSQEALELAASQPFDAALVDIALGPNSLNGVELAHGPPFKNRRPSRLSIWLMC